MKIYLDLIFFLNFFFDFLLLLTVSIMLKRNTKLSRLFLGSLLGSISIFTLFIKISSLTLFIFKVFISILMVISSFGFKNKKECLINILYLYFASIVLGGGLYYLNLEFNGNFDGLIFYTNKLSINIIVLIFLSPVVLYCYLKQNKIIKKKLNAIYLVEMFYQNKKYKYRAYLDTGNMLYDQYKKRPIVLLYDKKIKIPYDKCLIVPFKTLNNTSILRCIKVQKIIINNKEVLTDVLVGLSSEQFKIDDVEMILHNDLVKY